jgi:flagellar motor protein MotB
MIMPKKPTYEEKEQRIQELKQVEFSPQRLSAVGYEESRPVFPNDTLQHRGGNRRVEILLASKNKN